MKISIIIPNFNSKNLLQKNLPKVLDVVGNDAEIIIVDDASIDGSADYIKKQIDIIKTHKIKLIENKKNLGFSSTVNRGVKEAGREIIILLNTDVCLEPDFLQPLISHFIDPHVFAVGCLDKSIENGETILRGRGLGKWQRGFLIHRRGEVDKTNTLWVSCGSGAFRKSLWEKIGGLDEIYNPFYWEDIDLSYRAQKSGYDILFEPKSRVLHRHEEGVIRQNYSLIQVKTIAYRNQFIFVWNNIDDLDLLLSHLFWLPYHFLKAAINRDTAFINGFISALWKLPQILISRQRLSKFFKKSDTEVLEKFR